MKSINRHDFVCASLALFSVYILTTSVTLAAWEVVPDIELAVEARENARLREDATVATGDGDTTRMLFNGRFSMANIGERGDFFIEPRIRADAYADADDDDLQSDDYFLNARGRYTWERAELGFRSFFSRQSVYHSELLDAEPIDPDIDDPVAVDTGRLVRLEEMQNRVTLSPYVSMDLSERTSLLLETRLLDVSYSGDSLAGLTDFNDQSFSVGIVRQVNDRNRASARLTVSGYEADANQNQTDTTGVEGAFSRVLSDLWTFTLSTGVQRSEIAFLDAQAQFIEDVDTNVTLGLGFRKRSEIATLNFDLRRLIDPNSSGFLEQRDEVRLSLRRRMSPTMTGGVAFRIIDTNALESTLPSVGRDYARLDLSLEWALTRSWSLGLGYDTIYQKFANEANDQRSNSVSVGVNYRGLSRRGN